MCGMKGNVFSNVCVCVSVSMVMTLYAGEGRKQKESAFVDIFVFSHPTFVGNFLFVLTAFYSCSVHVAAGHPVKNMMPLFVCSSIDILLHTHSLHVIHHFWPMDRSCHSHGTHLSFGTRFSMHFRSLHLIFAHSRDATLSLESAEQGVNVMHSIGLVRPTCDVLLSPRQKQCNSGGKANASWQVAVCLVTRVS